MCRAGRPAEPFADEPFAEEMVFVARESFPTSFPIEEAVKETTEFLQRLVQFDTTNPPGNELECARWIAGVFEREGISATVVEPAPGRGSVIARLRGTGARRPLLLLSHLDVVPAVAADWDHPPFSGLIRDGEIWGRGTLDTKGLTAVWMEVMLQVKRLGLRLQRDLIFAATADEEMGGTWGVKWLVDNQPELLDCELALNEGGGTGLDLGGRTVFTYQTAEKGICWLRVTVHGTAGHASIPHSDNPVVHLSAILHKLGTSRLPVHISDTFRLFIERTTAALPDQVGQLFRMTLDAGTAEAALSMLPDEHKANTIRAMSRNTASPTVVRAGEKTNVIPQTATAEVDCRILPGQTPESLLAEVRDLLGLEGRPGEKVELELIRTSVATESPPDTELSEAIARAMARHDPEAKVVPYLVPGATDGRFLRPRGVVCYGFCPTLPDVDIRTVHGKNERLPLSSLEFGLKVLWDVVRDVAGTGVS